MAFRKISTKLLSFCFLTHVFTKGGLFLAFFILWGAAQEELQQSRNWGIAKDIAVRLQPHLTKGIDELALRRETMQFLQYLPTMEIFIVNAKGEIILSYSIVETELTRLSAIDMAPVYRFLDDPAGVSIPIRGTNPDGGRDVTFSAAPIKVNNTAHYVYAVLDNYYSRHMSGLVQAPLAFRYALLTTLVLVIIGFGAETICIRRSLKRFDGIVEKVSHVTAGEFNGAAPESGNDELSMLGASINTMSATISTNLEALRERDERRRELIANIWHDIRTPIAGVGALVQSLEHQKGPKDHISAAIVQRLSAHVDLLTRILTELQELGKLETGDIAPVFAACSAVEMADEMILIYKELAAERGLTFTASIPDSLPDVHADFTMIARVLSNLIENALRYTPKGGIVQLSLTEMPERGVRFAVTDTGNGIEPYELSRIFERDYQIQGQANGLAGLGLAIVKKIVEHHGSEIVVESRSGHGTCFAFMLPFAQAGDEPASEAPRAGSRSQTLILNRAELTSSLLLRGSGEDRHLS